MISGIVIITIILRMVIIKIVLSNDSNNDGVNCDEWNKKKMIIIDMIMIETKTNYTYAIATGPI